MGVIDRIKNLFAGDTTSTMGKGKEDVIFRMPQITDPYEDFEYPYTPMQKTKRFPKIVNAFALKERANADIRLLRNHNTRISNNRVDIDALLSRITALENIISARVFTETAISARQTLTTDRTHTMEASVETDSGVILVGMQAIYAYRVGEADNTSGAITIRDGWNYTKTQLVGGKTRHTFIVNVQNVYSGGQTSFELVVKPVFYQS